MVLGHWAIADPSHSAATRHLPTEDHNEESAARCVQVMQGNQDWRSLGTRVHGLRQDANESLGFQEESEVAALLNKSTSYAYSYEFGVP